MTAAVLDRDLDAELEGDRAPLMGVTEPRLWTRPLRELTPETSDGFEAIAFAEGVLGLKLIPWQKWWLIHALELRPDGLFRFKIILTLISRQNGKTFLLKILALYFLYVRETRLVLGTAQDLKIARESWEASYDLAAEIDDLAREFKPPARRDLKPGRRDANGSEEIVLADPFDPDSPTGRRKLGYQRRYRVSAATRSAGRGLTVGLLVMDEIREQRDNLAWAALGKTTIAVPDSLTCLISNAGDDESIVLNTVRAGALSESDESLGLFEWSAADGCAIDDREQWAQANPSLGYGTLTERALALALATDSPEVFRTECMCQHVQALDVLVVPEAWTNCRDPQMSLEPYRKRVVWVLDIAPDGAHATLVAGAVDDSDRVLLDVVKSWKDLRTLRTDLTALLTRNRPRKFGWFPAGPAAELGPFLRAVANQVEITGGDVTEACQGLVGGITRSMVRHSDDPLLTAHVLGVRKLIVADGYRFVRRGAGHADAAYAAAGAVQLAQTVPRSTNSGVWVV